MITRFMSLDRTRKSIARCWARRHTPIGWASGQSGAVEAFAVLRGLGDPHLNLYLKRIAVARPGQGVGTAFLSLVLDEAFGPLGAERFHLDCFADNVRAQRSYAKLGFTRDGVMRQAYRQADGTRTDLVMMAILKSEWEARALTGRGA